ncbi:methionyl-tRNA formyltransferase [Pelagirhabdus alkalitolerans]|uniref:Methionyl-tRNA formyltransferase n=1 Tax=Pelagirhabdus alkalitolerans TaxID=1612202 RepID=A0A1G6H2E3_9BACI|nr:methionyl-tRNA formyltransferase [Pelagirhabdus alkalitolerans]SDB88065.1 methionyl-tRNA formyltransferase [Pelagirhabdus alkalitolerans]
MKSIVFMGTPDFAVPVLRSLIEEGYHIPLVVTQPDRPKGRKKVMTPPPVKEEALKQGIRVFQPEKIKDDYDPIKEIDPDLIVTAAFGQILPKGLLDIPEYGCINVHASLLPEFRGGAPIHYALLKGKEKTGITIMYMVEALDAGDMLSQEVLEIEETDHVGTLHDKLSEIGSNLLLDTIPKLFEGSISPIQQNDDEATYAPNIKREQEQIDWNQSASAIYDHVRGLHPWPVASTTVNGKNMKVWWVEKTDQTSSEAPGKIVGHNRDQILVSCQGRDTIALKEIQLAGKKRTDVKDYLNGSGQLLEVGTQLGE